MLDTMRQRTKTARENSSNLMWFAGNDKKRKRRYKRLKFDPAFY